MAGISWKGKLHWEFAKMEAGWVRQMITGTMDTSAAMDMAQMWTYHSHICVTESY